MAKELLYSGWGTSVRSSGQRSPDEDVNVPMETAWVRVRATAAAGCCREAGAGINACTLLSLVDSGCVV